MLRLFARANLPSLSTFLHVAEALAVVASDPTDGLNAVAMEVSWDRAATDVIFFPSL